MDFLVNILNNTNFETVFTKETTKNIESWLEGGKNKFGWTEKFIFNNFFIIGNSIDESTSYKFYYGGGGCECFYSMYCFFSNGGLGPTDCVETSCSGIDGCGVFGNTECSGECL